VLPDDLGRQEVDVGGRLADQVRPLQPQEPKLDLLGHVLGVLARTQPLDQEAMERGAMGQGHFPYEA
jgi:hypothetical protein